VWEGEEGSGAGAGAVLGQLRLRLFSPHPIRKVRQLGKFGGLLDIRYQVLE